MKKLFALFGFILVFCQCSLLSPTKFPSERALLRGAVVSMAVGIVVSKNACINYVNDELKNSPDTQGISHPLSVAKQCYTILSQAVPYIQYAADETDKWSPNSAQAVGCAGMFSARAFIDIQKLFTDYDIPISTELEDAISFVKFANKYAPSDLKLCKSTSTSQSM